VLRYPAKGVVVKPKSQKPHLSRSVTDGAPAISTSLKARATRRATRGPKTPTLSRAERVGHPKFKTVQSLAHPPQFWQPRFYDFNVWSQTKFVEKLQYMHLNPVKRKLVAHPKDWPWSSFSFYARRDFGLLRIDPLH
jgi:hypothetical protein